MKNINFLRKQHSIQVLFYLSDKPPIGFMSATFDENAELNWVFESLSKEQIKPYIVNLMKMHGQSLMLNVVLPYEFYDLLLIDKPQLDTDRLQKALPWLCSEYLSYPPENGRYAAVLDETNRSLLTFCFSYECLLEQLKAYDIDIAWVDSIEFQDFALLNYVCEVTHVPNFAFIDLENSILRCSKVLSQELKNLYRLPFFVSNQNDLDSLRVQIEEIIPQNLPIYTHHDELLKLLPSTLKSHKVIDVRKLFDKANIAQDSIMGALMGGAYQHGRTD